MKECLEMKISRVLTLIILLASGCTQPGETTKMSAATGGVLGAGLGAIVGNQTGSAASGAVVGALAGSATGAAIGNAIEEREKALATQDEAIERQEQLIQAQRKEIEELRKAGSDSISFRRDVASSPRSYKSARASLSNRDSAAVNGAYAKGVREKDLVTNKKNPYKPAFISRNSAGVNQQQNLSAENNVKPGMITRVNPEAAVEPVSDNCKKADQEVKQARRSVEVADRLFHYRRALRLCPDNPSFHNGLGEVYLSLNRIEDARFEFKEALRIAPGYAPAKNNLALLTE
ncbi:MAG: tetratricopeptide repeat protein [Candidatus Dadabacteria bacterium]|nr:MAG: tetratricopeptide repeat protein [Candidatus Dadabacteria bacterium]